MCINRYLYGNIIVIIYVEYLYSFSLQYFIIIIFIFFQVHVSLYVQFYKEQKDLLRVVILGAPSTPISLT